MCPLIETIHYSELTLNELIIIIALRSLKLIKRVFCKMKDVACNFLLSYEIQVGKIQT